MTTVYQVQALDKRNKIRIVHAYKTESQALEAVKTMKKYSRLRYVVRPAVNEPNEHWGLDEPVHSKQ